MSNFKIEFSIDPSTREENWNKIQGWVTHEIDFFTAATSAFTGTLRFSDDEQFVEFKGDRLFSFLVWAMENVFSLNFGRNVNGHDWSIRYSTEPHKSAPGSPAHVKYQLEGDVIQLTILLSGREGFESSRDIWPDGMLFTLPLIEFNRAVGEVYDDMLTFLDDILEGIDGFEERFCLIPFRGEMGSRQQDG